MAPDFQMKAQKMKLRTKLSGRTNAVDFTREKKLVPVNSVVRKLVAVPANWSTGIGASQISMPL